LRMSRASLLTRVRSQPTKQPEHAGGESMSYTDDQFGTSPGGCFFEKTSKFGIRGIQVSDVSMVAKNPDGREIRPTLMGTTPLPSFSG
jgi:hypothetical protein